MGRLTLRFVVGLQLTTLRSMKKLLPAILTVAVVAVVAIAAAPRTAAPPSSLELANAAAAVAQANAATAAVVTHSIETNAVKAAEASPAFNVLINNATKYAVEAAELYERAKAGK